MPHREDGPWRRGDFIYVRLSPSPRRRGVRGEVGQEQCAPFSLPRRGISNERRRVFLARRFGRTKNVSSHHAETDVRVEVVRLIPVTPRTASIGRFIVERATTKHAGMLSLCPSSRTGEAGGEK